MGLAKITLNITATLGADHWLGCGYLTVPLNALTPIDIHEHSSMPSSRSARIRPAGSSEIPS